MTCVKSISFLMIVAVVSMLLIGGCATKRTAPHMGFGGVYVETKLSRDDVVILERVEGKSATESVLFGAIQVIDGEKVKVLGIPFFNDKFTCVRTDPCIPRPEDRAYYKALEATPEADAVFYKTMRRENSGIPLIWETETVTFSGKAISLKPDQPAMGSETEMISEPETDSEPETNAEAEESPESDASAE